MILHENRLPADDSYEISCLICYFEKVAKFENCCLLQIIGGALRVKFVRQCTNKDKQYYHRRPTSLVIELFPLPQNKDNSPFP